MADNYPNHAGHRLLDPPDRVASIRGRLILRISMVLFLTWFTAAVTTKLVALSHTTHFIQEQKLRMAAEWALVLSAAPAVAPQIPAGLDDGDHFLTAWRDGALILQRGAALLERYTDPGGDLLTIEGEQWIAGAACAGDVCVVAGFRDIQRSFVVRALVASIFLPLLLVLGVSIIAMGAAVTTGLAPLTNLTAVVRDRTPDDLSPVWAAITLRELSPLVDAINGLIQDLREQLRAERDFLNTCAHELRTPIAGLIAQIQSLNNVDAGTSAQLQRVVASARRVSRTTDQILTLARTSNAERLGEDTEIFDLCELIRRVTADIVNPYPHIECEMSGCESFRMRCNPLALEILCRNLVDNAVRHGVGPHIHGKILVRCEVEAGRIHFSVENSGCVIADKERDLVFEEFYRSSGSQVDGAGLGLSIVRDVVRHYAGEITVGRSETLGGTRICVTFPESLNALNHPTSLGRLSKNPNTELPC